MNYFDTALGSALYLSIVLHELNRISNLRKAPEIYLLFAFSAQNAIQFLTRITLCKKLF